jgi:hypothetical protein
MMLAREGAPFKDKTPRFVCFIRFFGGVGLKLYLVSPA